MGPQLWRKRRKHGSAGIEILELNTWYKRIFDELDTENSRIQAAQCFRKNPSCHGARQEPGRAGLLLAARLASCTDQLPHTGNSSL
jgi:hypothetical protein